MHAVPFVRPTQNLPTLVSFVLCRTAAAVNASLFISLRSTRPALHGVICPLGAQSHPVFVPDRYFSFFLTPILRGPAPQLLRTRQTETERNWLPKRKNKK